MNPYQYNKGPKMLISKCNFLGNSETSIKTVFTARTEKEFWEMAQCFHVSIMVKSKEDIPTYNNYIVFSDIIFKYPTIRHGTDLTRSTPQYVVFY